MVKVQSIKHPNTIISVDEDHYYTVLARSGTWQLYDEPAREKEKIIVMDKIVEGLNTPAPVVVEVPKRKAGRPKTKQLEA